MENILYKSTRGLKESFTASQAIIQGLAKDGGLFVPDRIPNIEEYKAAVEGIDLTTFVPSIKELVTVGHN